MVTRSMVTKKREMDSYVACVTEEWPTVEQLMNPKWYVCVWCFFFFKHTDKTLFKVIFLAVFLEALNELGTAVHH